MKRLTFASLMLLSLSAAAFDISLVKSPSAADEATAKLFEPDPAVARVYAYRDKSLLGKSVKSISEAKVRRFMGGNPRRRGQNDPGGREVFWSAGRRRLCRKA